MDGPVKRLFQWAALHCAFRINKRRATTISRAAGFRLIVPPTVFHPRIFLTSEFFADFISRLDLIGKRVLDVGTGTGILALAAARAGALSVFALDINPNAAHAAAVNAQANGLGHCVSAVCADLLSAVAPRPQFDVILSNMPLLPEEPVDLAQRAWYAGSNYRDVLPLYQQARERLAPTGRMYVLTSSEMDMPTISALFEQAHFHARPVHQWSHLIETVFIYELSPE